MSGQPPPWAPNAPPTPSSEDILNSWLRVSTNVPPVPATPQRPRPGAAFQTPVPAAQETQLSGQDAELGYSADVYNQALELGFESDDILSCFAHLQADSLPTNSLEHLLDTLNNLDTIRAAVTADGGIIEEEDIDDDVPGTIGEDDGHYYFYFHPDGRRLLVYTDAASGQSHWLDDETSPENPGWMEFPEEWLEKGTFIDADRSALSTENADYTELLAGGGEAQAGDADGAVTYRYFTVSESGQTFVTCVVNDVMYYADPDTEEWIVFPQEWLALGVFSEVPDAAEEGTGGDDGRGTGEDGEGVPAADADEGVKEDRAVSGAEKQVEPLIDLGTDDPETPAWPPPED